jgi:hypothetical protein
MYIQLWWRRLYDCFTDIESLLTPNNFSICHKDCLNCCVRSELVSVTSREEHRLRVFENRVLRKIFGPKGDEVTGEWRKLHSEELHILCTSPNIIRQVKSRRMRWAGNVARIGEERKLYMVMVGKAEEKRPQRKTKE